MKKIILTCLKCKKEFKITSYPRTKASVYCKSSLCKLLKAQNIVIFDDTGQVIKQDYKINDSTES